MGEIIFSLLELLGSLALFLFGIKMMSEALLKISGSRTRNIISAIKKNRFLGLLSGLSVTAIVQSSSATIVMLVSAVNAGIISLGESISVIMGANIGTTITGWMIAVFGFNIDIWFLILPIIGLSLPLVLSKINTRHSWGEFMLGFSLLFIGIHFLKLQIPLAASLPTIANFIADYADNGLLSALLFVFIGAIITIIVQSSSATMTFTVMLCMQHWIPFEMGVAMIIGENIGTTITANIAASVGNISSRRAATVHFLFNFVGGILALILFKPYLNFIDDFVEWSYGESPFENMVAVPTALATFHTSFNLFNSIIFIWFTRYIERFVMHIRPSRVREEEEFHLRFITTGLLSTSELSLLQAKKEISFFASHTKRMFGYVRELLSDENQSDSKFGKLYSRIEQYESLCDNVELEIANYLTKVNQGKLSDHGRRRAKAMIKIVGELESIGDSNFTMARLINRMRDQHLKFDRKTMEELTLMFNMVDESLDVMNDNLKRLDFDADIFKARDCETQINRYRDQIKAENFDNIKSNRYSYEIGVAFTDLIQECKQLDDSIINVTEDIIEAVE